MLRGLDICAGSGIGSAVWKWLGGTTVCYVEKDAYCQKLLQARIGDGVICDAPIWDDLRTFDGTQWHGLVDFIFGGIPCQPYSLAGRRGGESDTRDLWPDLKRTISQVGPRFVMVENVPGFLVPKRGCWREKTFDYPTREWTVRWWQKSQQAAIGRICGELAEIGYDAEWMSIPAAGVHAPHPRWRVWIVAYPCGSRTGVEIPHTSGQERQPSIIPERAVVRCRDRQADAEGPKPSSCNVADTDCERQRQSQEQTNSSRVGGETWMESQECRSGCGEHSTKQEMAYPSFYGMEGDGASRQQVAVTSVEEEISGCHYPTCRGRGRGYVRTCSTTESRLGGFVDGLADGMEQSWWSDGWDEGVPKLADAEERRNRLSVSGNGWVPQVAVIPMGRVAQLLAAEDN